VAHRWSCELQQNKAFYLTLGFIVLQYIKTKFLRSVIRMPIYEYVCNKCNETFSLLQPTGKAGNDTVCPGCGSSDVKKKISIFSGFCSVDPKSSGKSYSGFGGGG